MNKSAIVFGAVSALLCAASPRAAGGSIDLSGASLIVAPGTSGPERKAADMLIEEVQGRCQVSLPFGYEMPAAGNPVILLGTRQALIGAFPDVAARLGANPNDGKPEGYHIVTSPDLVIVAGNDARGVLYGAGRLLRLMNFTGETPPDHLGTVSVEAGLDIATAPKYALRGHQMGYRNQTNSYVGWSVPMWEQYYRDLVIFGANAIEGIPPHNEGQADSPHFTLPPMQMLIEQSRLAQEYGIEFWLWYPPAGKLDAPANVEAELKEWADVFARLPRLDGVFVPGGDPGDTPPKILFPFLEKQAGQLRRLHPEAKFWMSNQGFDEQGMKDFFALLEAGQPWLEGIVFGPHQRLSIEELRARVPKRYKMRFYPDITHSLAGQYPADDWDYAYATTENRETINPRPLDQAAIFRKWQPFAEYGFLEYSEGCNDDVNKCVWSCLGWNPDEPAIDIIRDYSHYFIGGGAVGEGFAQGIMGLERNWKGPLLTNEGVYTTLEQFQDLEHTVSPMVLENWRFQQALYRAYYDATDRARLIAETAREDRAMDELRRANVIGSMAAMDASEEALEVPEVPPAAQWRARTFELAEALFQSIHMKLSVPRYKAVAIRRGANLDLVDYPLNDAPWLWEQFDSIRKLPDERARLAAIDGILRWTDPGPGGFYDNLGNVANRPHLVPGKSFAEDPAFEHSPMMGFAPRVRPPFARVSSTRFAETLNDQPLEMVYHGLDRTAHYKVKIMYGAETEAQVRLVANGTYLIEPYEDKFDVINGNKNFWDVSSLNVVFKPREFEIPQEATAGGDLRLTWNKAPGGGGTGRGMQLAEVWLVRQN